MKTWIFLLIVIIVSCEQPGKNKIALNEPVDSFRWHMNQKITNYANKNLWDSSRNYLKRIEDTVRELKIDRITFYWQLEKVQQFIADKNLDSATAYLNQSIPFLRKNDFNYKDSFNLFIIQIHLLDKQHLYDSALRIANTAYYLPRGEPYRTHNICYELAVIYSRIDDPENMVKYAFKAWALKEADPVHTRELAQMLQGYYGSKNMVDSAIYYLKIVQRVWAPYNPQPIAIAMQYESTGLYLAQQGRLREGLENLLISKRIRDSLGLMHDGAYNNLADTYNLMGQYRAAFKYIDSSILLASESKDYAIWSLAWRTKSEIYFKMGQFKKAYAALDSSYTYNIEESDSSLRKYGREMETKYAVREKDNQIKTLDLTNKANLKIRKQQQVTIITMVIAILFLAFIGLLLWRRRQTQMLLRETNLKQQILRAQMDPHFVFNALAILQNLIRQSITEKALAYLNNLAKLMRFNFENARDSIVLLKSEMEALESYLNLQTMYHPGLFEYKIEVYEGFEDDEIYIPPMLLQPFVENSILHGFSQIDHRGFLLVRVEKKVYTLHVLIDDNGKGLVGFREKKAISSTVINQERLSILARQMGKPGQLQIIDKKTENGESGTRVEIEIPFRSIA